MANYPVLKMGAHGEPVRALQAALIARGYSCGEAGADGAYGADTYNAVLRYQRDNGLQTDGVAGNETQSHLYKTDYAAIGAAFEKALNAVRDLDEVKTLEVLLYGG